MQHLDYAVVSSNATLQRRLEQALHADLLSELQLPSARHVVVYGVREGSVILDVRLFLPPGRTLEDLDTVVTGNLLASRLPTFTATAQPALQPGRTTVGRLQYTTPPDGGGDNSWLPPLYILIPALAFGGLVVLVILKLVFCPRKLPGQHMRRMAAAEESEKKKKKNRNKKYVPTVRLPQRLPGQPFPDPRHERLESP